MSLHCQSRDAPVPRFPCATTTKIKAPRFAWFWNCGTISIVTFGMNLNFHRGRELGQHGSCEEPLQILAVPDPPCRKRVRAVSVVRAVVGTCPAGLSCAPLVLPSQLGQLLGAAGRAEPATAAAAAPSWRSASNKISRLFHAGWESCEAAGFAPLAAGSCLSIAAAPTPCLQRGVSVTGLSGCHRHWDSTFNFSFW